VAVWGVAKLLEEGVLLIDEGVGELGRGVANLFLKAQIRESWPVRDRGGNQIATVEPRGGGRTSASRVRGLITMFDQQTPRQRNLVVLGSSGETLLELQTSGLELSISVPGQGEVGAVRNVSRRAGNELVATFYEAPQRSWWRVKWGKPLASMTAPPQTYAADWEIVRDECEVIARIANPGDDGGRSVLEFVAAVEEPLHTVIVGFACALVYRRWLQIPPRTTPRT
jgi:hypothetical protein